MNLDINRTEAKKFMTELAAIKGLAHAATVQQYSYVKGRLSALKDAGADEAELAQVCDMTAGVFATFVGLLGLDALAVRQDSDKLIKLAIEDVKKEGI